MKHTLPFCSHLSQLSLAGLVLLALAIPPASAVPMGGSLQFSVVSAYYDAYPHAVSDLQSDGGSWVTSPAAITANAVAHGHATVFGSGSALWAANGNSGSMTMDYGWSAPAGVDASVGTAAANGANWSYSFVADADGFFTLNYDIVASGVSNFSRFGIPYFGLQGYNIYQTAGDPSGLHNVSLMGFDPTTSGQYVVSVLAGTSYTFNIVNGGNLSGMGINQGHGADVATDVSVHAEFNWSLPGAINSVPDSGSTLALLGLSLGVVGFALGRRRGSAA